MATPVAGSGAMRDKSIDNPAGIEKVLMKPDGRFVHQNIRFITKRFGTMSYQIGYEIKLVFRHLKSLLRI